MFRNIIGMHKSTLIIIGLNLLAALCHEVVQAKGIHKVHCSEDMMIVEITIPYHNVTDQQIYLNTMKNFPNPSCQPLISDGFAEFRLSLKDFYECGVTRMVNKLTGKKIYYHKIIIEDVNRTETVTVKCITSGPLYNIMNQTHGIVKRDILPAGFQEQEDLEITMSLTEHAPEPVLGVGVRQGGKLITGELNVSPGTPLSMEIYLDEKSSPVYGLGVTYMQVTDTKTQEEIIIFNGCSVDPYLFENFDTDDGDFLSAKFRAFKFPDSTYVQFRATVNVCLDKCLGTPCSNGQIGYGRRKRRDITSRYTVDPNKIYEISMATFIKVNGREDENKDEYLELEEKLQQLKIINQRLARNSRNSSLIGVHNKKTNYLQNNSAALVEETSPAVNISLSTSIRPILTMVVTLLFVIAVI